MENKNDIVAEVYQVIRNRHDVAFMDLDFIKKHNLFDFKNYDKTATIELDDTEANTDAILEEIFMYGNVNELFFENNPEARSISVSDIIKLNDKYYYCNPTGFEDVTEMVSDVKTEQKQLTEADIKRLSNLKNEPNYSECIGYMLKNNVKLEQEIISLNISNK